MSTRIKSHALLALLALAFTLGATDSIKVQTAITVSDQDGQWIAVTSPTATNLSSVDMVSAIDGWAVGENGTILRWDGSTWTTTASSTGFALSSVDMVSTTDGWAVGAGGTILHWNGGTWTAVASPTTEILFSVAMVTATDGWAVGNDGTILRWNGSAWTKAASPTTAQLFSVAMVSATDGWISGYDGTSGIMLHWNGSAWTNVPVPFTPRLFSVAIVSPTDGWAVAENAWILHWDGSTWSGWTNPAQTTLDSSQLTWLNSVEMVSANDGWAVGGFIGSSAIMHWDGTNWTSVTSPATDWLQDVAMVSATEGWAVGYGGNIVRYTTTTPSLTINYPNGMPGSFFTLTGSNFPPDSTATIVINGNTLTDALTVDSLGSFTFLLNTSLADPGYYSVTTTVNPSATEDFTLDPNAPLHPQEGNGPVFNVPSGIALTEFLYLPLVQK
jgi:photosystem II stability/assembly factor-like uncharacterized protein